MIIFVDEINAGNEISNVASAFSYLLIVMDIWLNWHSDRLDIYLH